MSSPIDSLATPHAIVDMDRVRTNIHRVHGYAKAHGLALRPHTKTHKDAIIGRLQIAAGAHGLTVATPLEAEVMAPVSQDLLVAYPPVDPARIARLLALPGKVRLSMALDSKPAVDRLAAASRKMGRAPVDLLVELDLGAGRVGTQSPEATCELARHIAECQGVRFAGVMLFPGSVTDLARIRERLCPHLEALNKIGLPAKAVSGGNTPTLFSSHEIPELSEIRPGTYVYSDRDMASRGILPWTSCAYSVVATVVSTAVTGQAVVDAGTKALAKEPFADRPGYGVMLDNPSIVVREMSEEHGLLDLGSTSWRPAVGDRVQLVPNHVCLSVHLQDEIAYLDGESLSCRPVAARGR